MPTVSSKLLCSYDAAAGTLAVTAEPAEAAALRAREQHTLFSAAVSACITESSAAARRIQRTMPALGSLSSSMLSAIAAQSSAAVVPAADARSRSGAVYASIGADSAGQQAMRAAADSGFLLNPATLASVQQVYQSAALNDPDVSGAALAEHGSVRTAIDAFMPDQQSGRSPCDASALLVYPSGPSGLGVSSISLARGSGFQGTVQCCSLVMTGIKLGPAGSAPVGETVSAAAGQPVESAATSMLYEVAWLASDHSTPAASSLPQASSAVGSVGVRTGYGKHVLAAVDSSGCRSIRRMRVGHHVAAIATSALEALQRFTGNAATTAVSV